MDHSTTPILWSPDRFENLSCRSQAEMVSPPQRNPSKMPSWLRCLHFPRFRVTLEPIVKQTTFALFQATNKPRSQCRRSVEPGESGRGMLGIGCAWKGRPGCGGPSAIGIEMGAGQGGLTRGLASRPRRPGDRSRPESRNDRPGRACGRRGARPGRKPSGRSGQKRGRRSSGTSRSLGAARSLAFRVGEPTGQAIPRSGSSQATEPSEAGS